MHNAGDVPPGRAGWVNIALSGDLVGDISVHKNTLGKGGCPVDHLLARIGGYVHRAAIANFCVFLCTCV